MLASPRAPTIPNGKQHANADSAASIAAAGAAFSTAFTNALHDRATKQLTWWNTAVLWAIEVGATTQSKVFYGSCPRLDVRAINANAGRAHKSKPLGFGLGPDFNLMNLILATK
jgi:hypothetical protein